MVRKFKPPSDKKTYIEKKYNEFLRIYELALGILDEVQYSNDVISDLQMVQIIFNHNLAQLQFIQDEQKCISDRMKRTKSSYMSYKSRILRFISCPCCMYN